MPGAYQFGRDPYDPAEAVAAMKATIAAARAEAEAARRDRQTGATPDPEPGDPT